MLNKGKCVNIGMIFIQKILQIGLCAKRCSRATWWSGQGHRSVAQGVAVPSETVTPRGGSSAGGAWMKPVCPGFRLHEPDCCVLDAPASRGLPSPYGSAICDCLVNDAPSLLEHCFCAEVRAQCTPRGHATGPGLQASGSSLQVQCVRNQSEPCILYIFIFFNE